MPLFDLPLDQLERYLPEREEPEDFDAFWSETLAEAAALPLGVEITPHDAGLRSVRVSDVRFAGWGGHPVAAWLLEPAGLEGPAPAVVHYLGYNGGRSFPHEWLTYPSAGYVTLVMDTRGQGAKGSAGVTPDPVGGGNGQVPGVMTRGVLDPYDYYYRRLFTDAVRAVDVVRGLPSADPGCVVVSGKSQGGGIAHAVAGLRPDLAGALIDVPFLAGFRRATQITASAPYAELVDYLKVQRDHEKAVFRTLSYMDGTNFAARATAPALYSVGLMDPVCPPSTVFGAYHHYAGPKEISVYPYNGHEGGQGAHVVEQLRWLADLLG